MGTLRFAHPTNFKSYTAKGIIECLERQGATRLLELPTQFKRGYKTESTYQIWEEGSHPQLLESEAVMGHG